VQKPEGTCRLIEGRKKISLRIGSDSLGWIRIVSIWLGWGGRSAEVVLGDRIETFSDRNLLPPAPLKTSVTSVQV
jgi:hypothetical protein